MPWERLSVTLVDGRGDLGGFDSPRCIDVEPILSPNSFPVSSAPGGLGHVRLLGAKGRGGDGAAGGGKTRLRGAEGVGVFAEERGCCATADHLICGGPCGRGESGMSLCPAAPVKVSTCELPPVSNTLLCLWRDHAAASENTINFQQLGVLTSS